LAFIQSHDDYVLLGIIYWLVSLGIMMNKDIALKMAIDAMEDMANGYDYILDVHGKIYGVGFDRVQEKAPKAIQACKEALEQPAQEPVDVARVQYDGYSIEWRPDMPHLPVGTKLYTHPHQWQGLTDDEIEKIDDKTILATEFARAIEQALRNKNEYA
jgi:hypothetical protein